MFRKEILITIGKHCLFTKRYCFHQITRKTEDIRAPKGVIIYIYLIISCYSLHGRAVRVVCG